MDAQEQLKALWSGSIDYDDLCDAAKDSVIIYAHFRAESILGLPGNAKMAAAIEREPAGVRDAVRKECRRIYNRRSL